MVYKRALNPVSTHPERITKKLRKQAQSQFNWESLEFPLSVNRIRNFEAKNDNIKVNVLGYDFDDNIVYPLRILNSSGYTQAPVRWVNLLLISKKERQHYCLINNMSRLLSSQTSDRHGKTFFLLKMLKQLQQATKLG